MNAFLFTVINNSHRKGTEQSALEPRDTETWEAEVELVPPTKSAQNFFLPRAISMPSLGWGLAEG